MYLVIFYFQIIFDRRSRNQNVVTVLQARGENCPAVVKVLEAGLKKTTYRTEELRCRSLQLKEK